MNILQQARIIATISPPYNPIGESSDHHVLISLDHQLENYHHRRNDYDYTYRH
jgi:hypothetical protein